MSALRRRPQWLAMVIGVCALIFGIGVAGMATAQPANAAIWDFCKGDQTFTAPLPAGGTASASPGRQLAAVGSNEMAWVTTSDESPATAYEGAGLTWYTFGASCADFQMSGVTMIANFMFQVFSVFPAKMLGILMGLVFGLGTFIADLFIGDGESQAGLLSPVLNSLHSNVFLRWAPLLIAAGLVVAMWRVARRRASAGWSSLGWLMAVIVGIGLLTSADGVGLIRKTNDAVTSITVCATFSVSGACTDSEDTSAYKDLANGMTETLAAGTWASGALGDISNRPFDLNQITFVAHDGKPKIHDSNTGDGALTVPIPLDAVPKTGSVPTWGEVWRWTQTYTRSEMAAMRENSSLRCLEDNSPSIEALSDKGTDKLDNNKLGLCSYKWIVRAAMTSYMVDHFPGQYQDMAGAGNLRVIAAIAGIGMLPLGWGIGIVGLMVLFYQLELIGLVLISPLVALISLRNPQAAKKWGGQIGASLVKRVAVGLVLGIILWMVSAVTAQFVNWSTGPFGSNPIPPYMVPFIVSAITVMIMITGFVLLGRVRDMILGGMSLPQGDGFESVAKKALMIGTSATAGALSAGAGLRLMGAGKALVRSGAIGGSSVRRGFQVGDRAGKSVRAKQQSQIRRDRDKVRLAERVALDDLQNPTASKGRAPSQPTPVMPDGRPIPQHDPEAPKPGARPGERPGVEAAWSRVVASPAAQRRREDQVGPRRTAHADAAANLLRVESELEEFLATRGEWERRRYLDLLADGESEESATHKAAEATDRAAQELQRKLHGATHRERDARASLAVAMTVPTDLERGVDILARRNVPVAQAAAALRLDDPSAAA